MITQVFALRRDENISYRGVYEKIYAPKWYQKIIKWLVKLTKLQEQVTYETITRVDIHLDKIPTSIIREIYSIKRSGHEAYTIIMGYDYYEKVVETSSPLNHFQLLEITKADPQFHGCSILCCPNITGFLVLPYRFIRK